MFRWLLLASLAIAPPAAAKWQSVAQIKVTGTTDFVGPGDVVSGATAWYGLRGYNAAVASTGTQKAINVRRQSDNATSDILIKTGGELDIAAAATFAGTDATCQGTIASTTMALTGCSSTPTANDPVSGGGIVQPSYITSCGAFVAGAGSCTLNATQTVSVAETITMQVALLVTEMYDQSGNSSHVTQPTAARQPQLLLAGCSSPGMPCINFVSANNWFLTGAVNADAQPFTYSLVIDRTGNLSNFNFIWGGGGGGSAFFGGNTINTVGVSCNSSFTAAPATDNAWHAAQAVCNGASSVISVDNVETTVSPGTAALATVVTLGAASDNILLFDGMLSEAGVWPAGFSPGNRTSVCHNQFSYWGTVASC